MGITHFAHLNGLMSGGCHFDVLDNSPLFKIASYFGVRENIRFLRTIPKGAEYDLVVVATPPSAHNENLKQVWELSDSFFVEKPLRVSRDVLSLVRDSDKQLMCGYVLRSNPCVQKLKMLTREAQPSFIRVEVKSNLGKAPGQDWRFDLAKGGGCLNELGSHVVNLGLNLARPDSDISKHLAIDEISVGAFSFTSSSNQNLQFSGDWNCDVRKTTYEIVVRDSDSELRSDLQSVVGVLRGKPYRWSPREEPLTVGYYMRGIDFALQAQHILSRSYSDEAITDAFETDSILDMVLERA